MRYTSTSFFYQQCLKLLRLGVVSALIAGFSQNSLAEEMPEGMIGWSYFISLHVGGYAADPVTACKLTARNHMNKALLDMQPTNESGTFLKCKYLSAMEAVNEVWGPQWYGATLLLCHPGYSARAPGVCVKRDEPPPPLSCKPGTPGFVLGNPVTISTGAKIQSEIDFPGTPAGALQITRTYRPFSQFISGQSAGTNWSFSFDRVLTIQRWSRDGRPLNLLGTAGDASHFSFYWNATKAVYESKRDQTATLVPLSPNYDEWLMVKNGRADRFKKHVDTNTGLIVRYQLISSQALDGGIQHFSYAPETLALRTIADEHGRVLEIGWGPYAVRSIKGAEGSVQYTYDWLSLNPEHEPTGLCAKPSLRRQRPLPNQLLLPTIIKTNC